MTIDGLFIRYITMELQSIKGKRVDKVFQPNKYDIVIHIGRLKLLISATPDSSRLHFVENVTSNPQTPPLFCMLLRKHIQGSKIVDIKQQAMERMVTLIFQGYNELGILTEKNLVVEIMGKHSNIILVDPNTNKIIDSIKRISSQISSYREILPGRDYKLPPQQNKIDPTTIENIVSFKEIIKDIPLDREKSLMGILQGIGPLSAKELIYQSEGNFEIIWTNLQRLINSQIEPKIYYDNDNLISFAPIEYKIFSGLKYKSFETISQMLEYFYNQKLKNNQLKQKQETLINKCNSLIDKIASKINKQEIELAKAENAEVYRKLGELLNANLHRIKPGDTEITVEDYYSHNLEKITIQLDPNLSPSQNAQKYYKKYSKGKSILKHLLPEIDKSRELIDYLKGLLQLIINTKDLEELLDYEKELKDSGLLHYQEETTSDNKIISPIRFHSPDGFEILVGKNNKQNDIVTFRLATGNDLWFHVKNMPGSHVLVKTNNRPVPVKTLEMAANIAAFYSKGKNSSNVPVDYTAKKNVKKPKGAKAGMVIYDNYQTITITPDPAAFERFKKG